ncbi:MAG: hypothetical protein CMJ39_06850 [Phycisphaerae bacterium]|nr:hypothetical protein [Phycisphaerae bacterium]
MNETEQFNNDDVKVQIQHEPAWPTVLGVIGIVWASIGILASGCAFFLTPEMVASWMPEEEQEKMLAEFGQSSGFDIGLQIVDLILAALLLWGSICLIRRLSGSRRLLNIWAMVSVLLTVIFTPVAIMEQLEAHKAAESQAAEVQPDESAEAETEEVAEANGGTSQMPEISDEATTAITVVSGACSGVVGLILPIIILCFINSSSGRRTIDSWQ